ncbi:type III-B CRISPR module-associated Cmr3 family protein [Thermocrinis sp.]
MKLLRLKPIDVLSFGTLKNFTAGESHYQSLEFPPPIMRFFSLGKDIKVMGVFLEKEGKVYLPLPADVLSKRKGEGKIAFVPQFDQELKRPFFFGTESVEQAKGFCSSEDFVQKYAKNQNFELVSLDEGLKREERTGVKLNYSSRIAQESYLYSRVFLRLMGASLLLLIEGAYDNASYTTVGGERKLARMEEKSIPHFVDFLTQEVSVDREMLYKFYATTHLYFDPQQEVRINNLRFSLEWISSQEPEWVSGFAKPFLYMLKPGTVLWLRAKDSGVIKRLCQISAKEPVKKFMQRGWNSGLLLEVR